MKKKEKIIEDNNINSLYREYYWNLYKYVYTITLNRFDTEDIVHNTFIKAMKNVGKFKGDSSIKTWLFRIAHNECMNYYRRPISVDIEDVVVVIEDEMEKRLCIREDVIKVLNYIGKQEEPMKSLMTLRLLDDYSFKEISEILNKTETWCRVTFFRLKQKLIDELV